MADIFIRRWYGKRGPYTEEELRTWMRDGKVSPRTPAWRHGMPEWTPLGTWGVMSTTTAMQRSIRRGHRHTYQRVGVDSPGINRMTYLVMTLLLNALVFLFVWATEKYGTGLGDVMTGRYKDLDNTDLPSVFLSLMQALLAIACALWLGIRRLQNIGWHWGWILLVFVPMVNVVLAACLLLLPPDYAATEKLDGWAWLNIVLFLLLIAAFIAFFQTPEVMNQIQETLRQMYPVDQK